MLKSLGHPSVVSLLRRKVQSSMSIRTCYDVRNKITGAYNPIVKRDGPSIVRNGDPAFFTKPTFEKQMKVDRTQSVGENFGVIPTKWEKFLLVITKLYQCQGDIPLYVSGGTMNRMHDRLRILSTFLAVCGFFSLFFYCHSLNVTKIMQDRESGVRV
ncbi:hypothetical protein Aduo_016658 [Ancylostoma duodenale]